MKMKITMIPVTLSDCKKSRFDNILYKHVDWRENICKTFMESNLAILYLPNEKKKKRTHFYDLVFAVLSIHHTDVQETNEIYLGINIMFKDD